MNAAQIQAVREIAENMKSVVKRSMTAKEMALTSHNLSRSGDMATTADGHMWIWDSRFEKWSMWK